jgi:hypothetical protein
MPDVRSQAVTGLVPPQQGEARIRERWPSVVRFGAVAGLGRALQRTILLAPLAWVLMAPFYFSKVLPFFARRYRLTNRRVVILGGWSGKEVQSVALKDIDDVRVQTDANSDFYRAGTVEIISNGQVALTLPGTPEPESYRLSILNARNAWVPEKAKTLPFIPASSA